MQVAAVVIRYEYILFKAVLDFLRPGGTSARTIVIIVIWLLFAGYQYTIFIFVLPNRSSFISFRQTQNYNFLNDRFYYFFHSILRSTFFPAAFADLLSDSVRIAPFPSVGLIVSYMAPNWSQNILQLYLHISIIKDKRLSKVTNVIVVSRNEAFSAES